MSPEFFITTLIVVASPGTGALYTIAAGLSRGARASVIAAFGCALGCLPHMAAAITGLAALLHTSAVYSPRLCPAIADTTAVVCARHTR